MKSSNETVISNTDKLSKRNLWSYSIGGVGRDMAYALTNTLLLTAIMLTKNISQKDFMWIGIIIIICRIFDGCNDPLMGAIIEKTRTKIGKFKPWILSGAILNSIIIMLLFAIPLQGTSYVIFFIFGYLLWGITYTMNDISYWGMMPSLTSNETDRNNLSTLANACAGIGAGIVSIAVPLFTVGKWTIGGSAVKAYPIIAGIVCVMFVIGQTYTVLRVQEKPLCETVANVEKPSLGKLFKVLFRNKQVLWTALTMLLYNIAASIVTAGLITMFVYIRFGYEGGNVSLFTTLFGICSAIIIFYPLIAKKFTRDKILTFCLISSIVGYALMMLVGLVWTGADSLYLLAVVGAFVSMGQTIFYMVLTIGIANCVEYNEWISGSRDEGMIFSIRPFMAKLGSALQMGIVTIIFLIIGIPTITQDISFIENEAQSWVSSGMSTELANQLKAEKVKELLSGIPQNVSTALLLCMTIIPSVLLFAAYLIYKYKCKISEENYNAIMKDISLRKTTGFLYAYTGAEGNLNNIAPAKFNESYFEVSNKEQDDLSANGDDIAIDNIAEEKEAG